MATIKLTIDQRRTYSDSRHPVVFRLTSKTRSTTIDANIKLLPQEWDSIKGKVNKTHPKSKILNVYLHNKLLEMEMKLVEYAHKVDKLNVLELKELVVKGDLAEQVQLKAFAEKEINSLKEQQRYGNAQSYQTALNRFLKFAGDDIVLSKIDYSLICAFDSQLMKEGLSRNSVSVYMREIRALLNIAIKKNIVDRKHYPFNSYRIKTQKTVSRAITREELHRIKEIELVEGTTIWHSRNIFLLIYSLIGISFIDLALLTQNSIQSGRIVYRRRKTGKIYSIKITSEAQRILSIYSNQNRYLISYFRIDGIPKNKEREEIALRLCTCNKYLKKLGKLCGLSIPLTTYVARYTWANVAKSLGFPKDQIAEALGHEYGNRITGIYLDNYGSDVIDSMNEEVANVAFA